MLVVVKLIGEQFDKEKGWLLALIFGATTLFVTEAMKFENDMFGYLFAYIGFYFLIKHSNKNSWHSIKITKELIASMISFLIAGEFWHGAIYFLIAATCFSWLYIIFFIAIAYAIIILPLSLEMSAPNFFWFINANTQVAEQQRIIGLYYLGVPMFFLVGALNTNKKIVLAFILMLIPCLFVSKLFVLPTLFASIICFNALKMIAIQERTWKLIRNVTIVSALLFAFVWANMAITQYPQASDINVVNQSINLSPNHIENDFSSGYIIEYYGGKPECSGRICEFETKGWFVGLTDQNYESCLEYLRGETITLYDCN